MPRLRQVPRAKADPLAQTLYQALFGDRDPITDPGTETGTPGNWWTVLANSPATLKHAAQGFQYYRAAERKLDPALRELGQMRAGWARGSQFVFSQHCKAARAYGVTEDQIAAIPHWQIADCFSATEKAVLAYTDALVLMGGRVADGIFDALKASLDPEMIVELTYIVAWYDMHAVISKALRLEFDDVPERVVEVPAPPGFSADVMRMVDRKEE
ncbi:MAG: carboxymuconolactone decarboxylase family protein [Sphingomonadaceae bacterium]